MDKCKHGFDHACLICGFTHIDGKKVWFDWAWQEQQKQIDELQARVDAVLNAISEHYESDGSSGLLFLDIREILRGEQALKGGEV